MSLPSGPPRYALYRDLLLSIKDGENGWRGYALQCALNDTRKAAGSSWSELAADGAIGPLSITALKAFQRAFFLTADGIAGPATQAKMLELLGTRTHTVLPMPDGLMRGFAEGEGANVLAATNWTVPGGVDCGPMQIRVTGPPFSQERLKLAFSPFDAMRNAASTLLERAAEFASAAGVKAKPSGQRAELAMRLAVLAHNWPYGADRIARTGELTSPNDPATWVPQGLKLPDGTLIDTRIEWCRYYALGWPEHNWPGSITKYVTDW